MSSNEPSERRDVSSESSPVTSPSLRPHIIEFIDSQDPNTRSVIQRHTAQHAAAQRREARLQAVRDGVRPRRLEWQRRSQSEASASNAPPTSETDAPTASGSLTSSFSTTSPQIPHTTDSGPSATTGSPTESAASSLSPNSASYSPFEKSILQHCSFGCSSRSLRESRSELILSISTDQASTYLLIAYYLAIRAQSRGTRSSREDAATSIEYRSRGQDILLRRLQDPTQASSNSNIQAVLILIALVSDFGDRSETHIHISGLRNMITQRGGVDHIREPLLQRQLLSLATSKTSHLTLQCTCTESLRFTPEQQEAIRF